MSVGPEWPADDVVWPGDAAGSGFGEPAGLLPEGTKVRVRLDFGVAEGGCAPDGEAVGEVTGLWWSSAEGPPRGYTVQVGPYAHCVTPEQVEVI